MSLNSYEKLREYIELQRQAAAENDYHSFMLSDRAFHKTFFELAGNFKLTEIMDNFQDICHMIGVCYLKVDGLYERAINDHEAVLKSIETGDADRAETAIANHINQVKTAVIETITSVPKSVK